LEVLDGSMFNNWGQNGVYVGYVVFERYAATDSEDLVDQIIGEVHGVFFLQQIKFHLYKKCGGVI